MDTFATGINKPRLFVGIDKRLFVVCFLLACGALWGCQRVLGFLFSLVIGAVFFVAVCIVASKLTGIEPQMVSLFWPLLWQKAVYDIGRRDNSRAVIEDN